MLRRSLGEFNARMLPGQVFEHQSGQVDTLTTGHMHLHPTAKPSGFSLCMFGVWWE